MWRFQFTRRQYFHHLIVHAKTTIYLARAKEKESFDTCADTDEAINSCNKIVSYSITPSKLK